MIKENAYKEIVNWRGQLCSCLYCPLTMLFLAKTILEDKIEVLSKSSIKLKVFENENKVVFKDNRRKKVANGVKVE